MRLLSYAALLLIPLASTSAVMAQDAPPGFMETLPFSYKGKVMGMDAWTLNDQDLLFIVSKDKKTVITGYVFDAQGNDIGSTLTGTPGVNVWESLSLEGGPDAAPPAIEPISDQGQPEIGLMTFPDDLDGSSGALIQGGVPDISPIDPALLPATVVPSVDDTINDARRLLEGIPEDQKRDLLIDLVQRIDRAKTPEEFQVLLIEWNETVQGKKLISDEEKAALAQQAPVPIQSDVAPSIEQSASPISPVVQPSVVNSDPLPSTDVIAPQADPAATEAVGEKKDGATFLEEMRKDTFWFAVGDSTTPAVYAFIDPTCPHCARAMNNLKGDVESGKMHLRVILAPLVSKDAPDTIAGILLSEDPAKAFWDHEIKKAQFGSSDLEPKPFSSLSPEVNAALKGNFDMVVNNQLPGVPFFGWVGADGPQFYSGVPDAGHFAAAKTDDYNGNN